MARLLRAIWADVPWGRREEVEGWRGEDPCPHANRVNARVGGATAGIALMVMMSFEDSQTVA